MNLERGLSRVYVLVAIAWAGFWLISAVAWQMQVGRMVLDGRYPEWVIREWRVWRNLGVLAVLAAPLVYYLLIGATKVLKWVLLGFSGRAS